ncbi:hypothetical protein K3495_g1983 [Podosphaera aphanis]|nr:hypothetical protein K3495_g1983 [Podosphaera aphanis]
MQSLNPFLRAFFKSALPSQCTPAQNYILLVPTTEILLTSYDRESGTSYADLATSDEFLGSHVLRVPSSHFEVGVKDFSITRENRGKAKQYTTINGKLVVIKDAYIYSNKGFKTNNQAQLLSDNIFYPNTLEPLQWLIYFISKPLVGIIEDNLSTIATLQVSQSKAKTSPESLQSMDDSFGSSGNPPVKKKIRDFNDLLNNFSTIAKQMQPGLDQVFKDFNKVFESPLPSRPSTTTIHDSISIQSTNTNTSSSQSSLSNLERTSQTDSRRSQDFYLGDEEDVMRGALETAVTSAIDLFQMVDKQQLSLLGAMTDLTGPVVERLIERYITENVHESVLFPRLCALNRSADVRFESLIRRMALVDISQVGIPIQGGKKGKHELNLRLARAVEEFRNLTVAGSPQQMMDILLLTLKTVTKLTEVPESTENGEPSSEKVSPVMTINADVLVSLLLIVVIRAKVRHLQACLHYMRYFIFIDDVERGEMGYGLSTFEAVLSYISRDSQGLRKASRRNQKLWEATKSGKIKELTKILEPDQEVSSGEDDTDDTNLDDSLDENTPLSHISFSRRGSLKSSTSKLSNVSLLGHVFPWQNRHDSEIGQIPGFRKQKNVTMDMRRLSSSSEASFISRATTIDSISSGFEGDTSIERLAQTENSLGESVPMMAVQSKQPESLKYLLSLKKYFPPSFIIEDLNNNNTTLLNAAVQLGHTEMINIILEFLYRSESERVLTNYFALQDNRGRSIAHYLFNAPLLITKVGRLLPWRQKDQNGQTPLFALCRSYDHSNYRAMVAAALIAATASQNDGEPLHLDDHVDAKGNTLLHIINDSQLAFRILIQCDCDVNATNDKKFTPFMVASKYGRLEMIRVFFEDERVDLYARELRGLTAVELAKDDDVRNRIDDLVLLQGQPAPDGRLTSVVRSYFVQDATIRLVLKSGAPSIVNNDNFTLTTCRRSLNDFDHLANLLAMEHPASWLPSISGMRCPFQLIGKPSKAILRDIQVRLDSFVKILLSHSTFATHEMLWEFFLVPDIQPEMMEQRSKLKAETRIERVREELGPVEDVRDVEQFVNHARDMVLSVNYSTKSVARRANMVWVATTDLFESCNLASRTISTLESLPQPYSNALEAYAACLAPPSTHPYTKFHSAILSLHSTVVAMLSSLSRPNSLITTICASKKSIERSFNSLSRSTRWPLGLLDETRQRLNEEKEERVRKEKAEVEELDRELRYTWAVVASELAGWQEGHERMARRAVKELVRGMVIRERTVLEGMKRALRKLKLPPPAPLAPRRVPEYEDEDLSSIDRSEET